MAKTTRIAVYEGFGGQVARAGFVSPSGAAPVTTSHRFPYQSYFDDTALEKALLAQPVAQPIVPDSMQDSNTAGFGLGLHPSSETPIAFELKVGNKGQASQVFILKPGQVIWPFGRDASSPFSGFRWGIPFGWLGGGLASVVVFQRPDSEVDWGGNPEVIFHRLRLAILANNANLGTTTPTPNWPTRFPWEAATRYTAVANQVQTGSPSLSVEPTRTLMRLRIGTLAAAATMRILMRAHDAFDLGGSAGTTRADACSVVEHVWPETAAVGTGGADQYITMEAPSILTRLGCEAASGITAGVQLIAAAASNGIENAYVDLLRFGRLG